MGDKIVFEFQKPAPRKHSSNGANPMDLMPSLRHKAMSPKPDGEDCKHGREQGSRGRSRSRADQAKEGEANKIKPRSRSRSVSWGRDKLEDKKTSSQSTRYPHLKPAIKKPDTISVPIHTPFRSSIRKEEDASPPKHQLPSSTETSVHPPWRYGAEMSSMSSSAEMSGSQRSSTIRRSQLEQRERRVSASRLGQMQLAHHQHLTALEVGDMRKC